MSARTGSAKDDTVRRTGPPDDMDEPQIDPIDDALWHLQIEARRVAQLVRERPLTQEQRRDLARSIAALRAAMELDPSRQQRSTAEPEPAL